MFRYIIAVFLCVIAAAANAQGYIGAVAALSSVGIDCAGSMSCDKKGNAIKLYAGSKLAADSQIDLGFGKFNAIEVGLINFGKASRAGMQSFSSADLVNGGVVTVDRSVSNVGTANALTVAAVVDMPVTSDLAFAARFGLAYVSSTIRTYIDGVKNGSETATKLKPYIGLGASFVLMDAVKVVGSYDLTAFDVAGHKSHASALGLGAEMSF